MTYPRHDKIAIWIDKETVHKRLQEMKVGKDYLRTKIGQRKETFDDVIKKLLADHDELVARISKEAMESIDPTEEKIKEEEYPPL